MMSSDTPGFSQRISDDQLRKVTVGEPVAINSQITLVDYDPAWPEHFAGQERIIRAALGSRARQIEHAGSTAVPGLPAKPIIDIVLVVADSADESAYVPALETEGYVLRIREPDWEEHRVLKRTDPDVNLHVFTTGRGTPYGLKEVPVVKVATRSDLARRWHDLMDVNAGRVVDGEASIEEMGWELFRYMIEVASGRAKTCAETLKLHNSLALFNPAPIT